MTLRPVAGPHTLAGTADCQRRRGTRRLWPDALAALACAVAIVACGSARTPATTAASVRYNQALLFAKCMRSHGVSDFPDPSAGGGIHIQSGSGVDPFSPAFKAARARCAKLLPGGGPGGGHPSSQEIAAARQTSECMRRHGITGFPDPTLKPPSSPAGYSILENRGGVILAVPRTIDPNSPAFLQAAKSCHFS